MSLHVDHIVFDFNYSSIDFPRRTLEHAFQILDRFEFTVFKKRIITRKILKHRLHCFVFGRSTTAGDTDWMSFAMALSSLPFDMMRRNVAESWWP